jgi:hypothetical protein
METNSWKGRHAMLPTGGRVDYNDTAQGRATVVSGLETVSASDDLKRKYNSMKENPLALAIHLIAEGFLSWVKERKKERGNQPMKSCLH